MEHSSTKRSPSQTEIAALAEKIYIDSGCIPGRDLENWLLAEAELKESTMNAPRSQRDTEPASGKKGEIKPIARNKVQSSGKLQAVGS
jgi:hypothetical protein